VTAVVSYGSEVPPQAVLDALLLGGSVGLFISASDRPLYELPASWSSITLPWKRPDVSKVAALLSLARGFWLSRVFRDVEDVYAIDQRCWLDVRVAALISGTPKHLASALIESV
jgi:hypothetical protein